MSCPHQQYGVALPPWRLDLEVEKLIDEDALPRSAAAGAPSATNPERMMGPTSTSGGKILKRASRRVLPDIDGLVS